MSYSRKGKWSMKYDECIKCKSTLFPHNAKGYCEKCYDRLENTQKYRKLYNKTKKGKFVHKEYRDNIKRLVLEAYSGKYPHCACCGESTYQFLTIDHINGGGHKHRKEIKIPLTRWLYKNNCPQGFQVLCMNCNLAKGMYGVCPHKGEKNEIT